jgi:HTH-type transcriptional regulator / antitoxin HipB
MSKTTGTKAPGLKTPEMKPPVTKRRTAAGESGSGGRRPGPSQGAEAFARYERARTAIMVGSAVRAARRRSGVSQAELARRAKTSQPSIARLEKGQVSPTVISLDRIARALGTELIIDFEPVSPGYPEASVRAK